MPPETPSRRRAALRQALLAALAALWIAAPAAAQQVLYVAGNPTPIVDAELRAILQLELLGFTVNLVDDDTVTEADATGMDLVYISASVASGKVGNEFETTAIPVVVVETFVLDDMGMTGGSFGTDLGGTTGQTTLDIAGSGRLAAGLSGTVTISGTAVEIFWGVPAPAALVGATEAGTPGHAAVFGYETGAAMVTGTAPARRVALPLGDDVADDWTADMVQLFNAAIAWATSAPAPATVRIQPLGDSITEGFLGLDSYRVPLWPLLAAQGCDVDFTGSVHTEPDGVTDGDHEGHSGFRTDEIEAQLAGWLVGNAPDVVLLHLGTNDILQSVATNVADQNLRDIIGLLRVANPNVTVLLAQVIPNEPANEAATLALNAAIATIAGDLDGPASPVLLVDHYTGYDGATLNADGIHPNATGEARMAQVWTDALLPVLGAQTCSALTPVPASSRLGTASAVALLGTLGIGTLLARRGRGRGDNARV